jgi:hypothetical protein
MPTKPSQAFSAAIRAASGDMMPSLTRLPRPVERLSSTSAVTCASAAAISGPVTVTVCEADTSRMWPVRASTDSTFAGSRPAATARSTAKRTSSVWLARYFFCTPPTRRRTGSAIVMPTARFAPSGSDSQCFDRPAPPAISVSTVDDAVLSSIAPVGAIFGSHTTLSLCTSTEPDAGTCSPPRLLTKSSTAFWPPVTVTSQTRYRASAVRSIRLEMIVS